MSKTNYSQQSISFLSILSYLLTNEVSTTRFHVDNPSLIVLLFDFMCKICTKSRCILWLFLKELFVSSCQMGLILLITLDKSAMMSPINECQLVDLGSNMCSYCP